MCISLICDKVNERAYLSQMLVTKVVCQSVLWCLRVIALVLVWSRTARAAACAGGCNASDFKVQFTINNEREHTKTASVKIKVIVAKQKDNFKLNHTGVKIFIIYRFVFLFW